jgi:hypothetical protein
MSQDPFLGAREVTPSQVSFSKIGDYIIGYFNGSKDVIANDKAVKIYELKGIQGEFHTSTTTIDDNGNKSITVDKDAIKVGENEFYTVWGGKSAIDDLFKKAKLGQKVGIRFERSIPSKTKGNAPFKEFKTVMWDEYDTTNPMDGAGLLDGAEVVEGVEY